MESFPHDQFNRREFMAGSVMLLGLGGCTRSVLVDPESLEESGFDPDGLIAAVKANQIVFEPVGDALVPVVKCGHRIPYDRISNNILQAVIAIEDHRFYAHRGFDPLAVAVALAGGGQRGGSTITMQLIKNTVLSPVREYDRKMAEVALAALLEEHLGKAQILRHYLNAVTFGHLDGGVPIVGVETAARYYFGRTAADVDLYQAAVLAGMLKAPNRLNPVRHPDAARQRASTVLNRMAELGMISEPQEAKALRSQRTRGPADPLFAETRDFAGWILSEVKRDHPSFVPKPYTRILITLQGETQFRAREALDQQIARSPTPSAQGAFVTMSPGGRIACLIGQRDFAKSQMNFATRTRRPPASTFKPIIYLAALEEGVVKATKTLTADFAASDNDRSRELLAKGGVQTIVSYAKRLGIRSDLRADPSLALGTSETTLLEMTAAFTAFASRGYPAQAYGYFGIIDESRVSWWRPRASRASRMFGEERGKQMHNMLRAVVTDGTGKLARSVPEAAGKTGTSDGPRDAWFIGYTPRHVSGLWIGQPNNALMNRTMTGSAAAGIWAHVERALPSD